MPYSDLRLAASNPPQGLSPYPQAAWALDLLEWTVVASSGVLGSSGNWTAATGHGYGGGVGGEARLFPGSVIATRVLICGEGETSMGLSEVLPF